MKKQVRRLTDYLTYAASSTISMDLPRDGVITELLLEWYLVLSGAIVGASEDIFGRLIGNGLEITGPGNKKYYSITDGRMAQWLDHFTNQKGVTAPNVITAATTTTAYFVQRIHFGSQPYNPDGSPNPFDLTCGVPGNTLRDGQLSSLKLKWISPANTVCDPGTSGKTIGTTTTCKVTVFEVLDANPMTVPAMEEVDWAADAAYSNLGKKWDFPTGVYVKSVTVLANDHTAFSAGTGCGDIRKDDQVTELAVQLPKEGNRAVIQYAVEDLKAQCQVAPAFFGNESTYGATASAVWQHGAPIGAYHVDFRKYTDPAVFAQGYFYGLDQLNKQPGNLKLAMTIGSYTSGDDVKILWEEMSPF